MSRRQCKGLCYTHLEGAPKWSATNKEGQMPAALIGPFLGRLAAELVVAVVVTGTTVLVSERLTKNSEEGVAA